MKEKNGFTLRCDECKRHVPCLVDGKCKECRGMKYSDESYNWKMNH